MKKTTKKVGRFMTADIEGAFWAIRTVRGRHLLGLVEWNSRWREFEFAPDRATAFTTECLADLAAFLKALNAIGAGKTDGGGGAT